MGVCVCADGQSDLDEWERMAKFLSKKYPLAGNHLQKM